MVLRYRKRLPVELLYHKANKKPPTGQASSSQVFNSFLNSEDLFDIDFNIYTNSAKDMEADKPKTKEADKPKTKNKPPTVPRRQKKPPGDKDETPGTSGPAQGTSAPAQGTCRMNLRKITHGDYLELHEGMKHHSA